MHRRGGFGLEQLLGCAGDLLMLWVVFGRASGVHVGLSGGHFGAVLGSFEMKKRQKPTTRKTSKSNYFPIKSYLVVST